MRKDGTKLQIDRQFRRWPLLDTIRPHDLGIALISGGLFSLALKDRHLSGDDLAYAFGTGCFIGAYSVTDGLGVRLAGDGIAYTAWMCLLWSAMVFLIYLIPRDWRSLKRSPLELLAAGGGGVVSILAYGIVIQAMSLQPMGPVSALRETSVVFAALLGRVFLHERLTTRRIAACAAIAIGAACLAANPPL
ncbi:EamA family transporter [Methylocapsa aurea]|uniref:EamA family transporter n=1 Tax=Methylocapsa aurea TaxID=663610 RepID=UPI003D18E995